jgi:hypothetical protein
MAQNVRGPFLSDGYPGQVLVMDPIGSSRTVWTDPSNLGLGDGGGGGGGGGREVLVEDRTYFVTTTGDDANDGLTAETAFLTINHAVAVVSALDLGKCLCTVDVEDGTYPESIMTLPIVGGRNEGSPKPPARIIGNKQAPQNVVIGNGTSAIYLQGSGWHIEGFKTILQESATGILVSLGFDLSLGRCIIESAAAGAIQPILVDVKSRLYVAPGAGGITISGPRFFSAIHAKNMSFIDSNAGITVAGNPLWDGACVEASNGAVVRLGAGFSGVAQGRRYRVSANAIIDNLGRGIDQLPGDTAGEATTGGQYL